MGSRLDNETFGYQLGKMYKQLKITVKTIKKPRFSFNNPITAIAIGAFGFVGFYLLSIASEMLAIVFLIFVIGLIIWELLK